MSGPGLNGWTRLAQLGAGLVALGTVFGAVVLYHGENVRRDTALRTELDLLVEWAKEIDGRLIGQDKRLAVVEAKGDDMARQIKTMQEIVIDRLLPRMPAETQAPPPRYFPHEP